MTEMEPLPPTAADAAFLERCRWDPGTFSEPSDEVGEIVRRLTEDGCVELEAGAVVSGRPGAFSASGGTVVEASGRLRGMAPEERLIHAFRAVVDEIDPR
jgi:hypothetical protein